MKLLIGCDGSSPFGPVLEDLQRAGLPEDCRATLLTVAKRSVHARMLDAVAQTPPGDGVYAEIGDQEIERLERACLRRIEPAAERLREVFPLWTVTTQAAVGRAAEEICELAEAGAVDLVVVGAHDRGSLDRILFGSTTQGVLAHCTRSVRVSRPARGDSAGPPTLLLATDGSAAAGAAKREIARRPWPRGTSVRVLSLVEPRWVAPAVDAAAFNLDAGIMSVDGPDPCRAGGERSAWRQRRPPS